MASDSRSDKYEQELARVLAAFGCTNVNDVIVIAHKVEDAAARPSLVAQDAVVVPRGLLTAALLVLEQKHPGCPNAIRIGEILNAAPPSPQVAQQLGPCSCQDSGKCKYIAGSPACMNALYEAAKDLHDYLRENIPDIIEISTSSQLAGDGVKKRLQALKEALQ